MNFEKAILFSIRHENQSILSAVHQRPDMKVKSAMGHSTKSLRDSPLRGGKSGEAGSR